MSDKILATRQRVTSAGAMYGDVLVTANAYAGYVMVTAKPLQGGTRWAEPTTQMTRELVDAVAADVGKKRIGRREHIDGWTYRYTLSI